MFSVWGNRIKLNITCYFFGCLLLFFFCAIETCWYTHTHISQCGQCRFLYLTPTCLRLRHNVVVFPPILYTLFAACILSSAMLATPFLNLLIFLLYRNLQDSFEFLAAIPWIQIYDWLPSKSLFMLGDSTCKGVVQLQIVVLCIICWNFQSYSCACLVLAFSFHLHLRICWFSSHPPPYIL